MKMSETIALTKNKQSQFSRKIKNVKKKVKRGVIKIKTNVTKVTKRPDHGLVYIGHIPHGFYETEMKEYFSQFGKVTNVRVSRSKNTGRSKGYAFVEFADTEVAQVVAETMNNYLMFNRRLIATYIPPEKQRRHLFLGKAWSVTDYPKKLARKIQIARKNKPIDEDQHQNRVKRQMNKIQKKVKKLAEFGIIHNFKPSDMSDESKVSLLHDSTDEVYKQDPYDSDIEIKVTRKKEVDNRKVIKPLKGITKVKNKLSDKNVFKHKVAKNEKLLKLAASQIENGFIVDNLKKVKKLATNSKRIIGKK